MANELSPQSTGIPPRRSISAPGIFSPPQRQMFSIPEDEEVDFNNAENLRAIHIPPAKGLSSPSLFAHKVVVDECDNKNKMSYEEPLNLEKTIVDLVQRVTQNVHRDTSITASPVSSAATPPSPNGLLEDLGNKV